MSCNLGPLMLGQNKQHNEIIIGGLVCSDRLERFSREEDKPPFSSEDGGHTIIA